MFIIDKPVKPKKPSPSTTTVSPETPEVGENPSITGIGLKFFSSPEAPEANPDTFLASAITIMGFGWQSFTQAFLSPLPVKELKEGTTKEIVFLS